MLTPIAHLAHLAHLAQLARTALAACALLLLLAACPSTPRGASNAKVALVIGNAAYENVPALKNPVNDANDMCTVLRKLGFRALCHTNLRDRAELDARVNEYAELLGPDSLGVVYYSGHGVQASNANFLIPTQVQQKAASDDPLRVLYGLEDLFKPLRRKPVKHQLVILDACRTDLFAQAQPASGGALVRALATTGRASYGLASIQDAPPRTLVLYGTASKGPAYEGKGRNGTLTKHVLAHIGTPGRAVVDIIALASKGVEGDAENFEQRQAPVLYGPIDRDFCLTRCGIDVNPGVAH